MAARAERTQTHLKGEPKLWERESSGRAQLQIPLMPSGRKQGEILARRLPFGELRILGVVVTPVIWERPIRAAGCRFGHSFVARRPKSG